MMKKELGDKAEAPRTIIEIARLRQTLADCHLACADAIRALDAAGYLAEATHQQQEDESAFLQFCNRNKLVPHDGNRYAVWKAALRYARAEAPRQPSADGRKEFESHFTNKYSGGYEFYRHPSGRYMSETVQSYWETWLASSELREAPQCSHKNSYVISWNWSQKPPTISLKCGDQCGQEMYGEFTPKDLIEVADWLREAEAPRQTEDEIVLTVNTKSASTEAPITVSSPATKEGKMLPMNRLRKDTKK
jgi:hypothetical protein